MGSIVEINLREQQLISLVENAQGTMEEKYSAIEDQGIFEAYKAIHQEYADLSCANIEALKRAVFLFWYVWVEPSCYTGLSDLNPGAVAKTMSILNHYLLKDLADNELKWMLSYYFVWDFVFDKYVHLEDIAKLLQETPEPDLPEIIDRAYMAKRGQMGKYWNSLTIFQQL